LARVINRKSLYAKYRVGDATQITLLRAVPGGERKVASRLCDGFPGAALYKLFGEADFGIIQRFDGQPKPVTFAEELRRDIRDINTLICFNWEGLDSVEFSKAATYSCAGLCFLKANVEFMSESGIMGEQRVLEAIKRYISEAQIPVQVGVYGTLGWFETLLIIYGNSHADILSFANTIRQAVISSDRFAKREPRPCFETTTTIPAVICKDGKIPADIELDQSISLEVRISCYSWADLLVRRTLHQLLGDANYLAGTEDFVVSINRKKIGSLTEYINKLWDFREQMAGRVYSTHTNFTRRSKGEGYYEFQITQPPPERITVDLTNKELVRLEKADPGIYQMLRHVHGRINDLLSDYRQRGAVSNLVPFAEELLFDIQNPPSDPSDNYVDNPQTLGKMLEMLLFGLQQRTIGIETYDSHWIGGVPYVGGGGGIQRVLLALSSIPTSIMKQLDKIWTGFTILGWSNTYHRYPGGVINVPAETLHRPDLWFGVFHEVGHEYGIQINIADDPRFKKALSEQGLYSDEQLIDLSAEIYAEIFACLFGFNGDFDQCLAATWHYLVELAGFGKEELLGYYLRFLMTYVFMIESSGDKYVHEEAEFIRLAKRLRTKLVRLVGDRAELNEQDIRRLSSYTRKLRVVLNIIRDRMPAYNKVQAKAYHRGLSQGKPIVRLDSPSAVIQRQAYGSQGLSFQQAIATILSLWNYQVQTSRHRSDQLKT
jgi:hypothetical protein